MAKAVPEMKEYVLTERLGCGTFATVYKAYRKGKPKEVVAIKCIEKKRLNKRSMENLLTEISVMKDLDHRHVVKLIDFQWDERYIFLIMEYCDGGDLSHFIANKIVLGENSARKFLRQLALALQFLRGKGIAHMDLKPQNLLLTGVKPVLKVGDFGMAQHLGVGDVGESFRGSPLYMAPEIMRGESYDAKVDLWSVGVILYETLYGEAPFASTTFSELESKVRNSNPVVIPSTTMLSDECRDLLQKLLQRDSDKRISFDDFFKHPFIDLEHAPSLKCLPQARELVTKAVTSDSEGRLSTAITFYTQALEYFIPALEFEEDQATRDALRQKIEQYIQRTEYLKETIRSKKTSHHATASQLSVHQLEKWQTDFPEMKTAVLKTDNAEKQYNCGNYAAALESYKQAVAILMPVVEKAPTREEKQHLKVEIKKYLDRAEEIAVVSQNSTRLIDRVHSIASETVNSKCRVQ